MGISSNGGGADVGDIKAHAKATIPDGWLACGGQAVSRTTYAALFLAIGTLYGAGDGSTTFNLPDLRGRSLFGKDDLGGVAANRLTTGGGGVNGVVLGAVGGGQSVTLTEAQTAVHTHTQNSHTHGYSAGTLFNKADGGAGGGSSSPAGQTSGSATPTNNNAGSSGAHANIPPAIVTNFIIKA